MRSSFVVVVALAACANNSPAEQPNAVAVPADAAAQQPPAGSPASSSTPKTGVPDASTPEASAPDAASSAAPPRASSSAPAPKCPPSYAAAQKAGACGGAAPPTPCTYPEGTCDCELPCMGGAQRRLEALPPAQWTCAAKSCTPTPTAGAKCTPEGTHCGRCFGDAFDCNGGKWAKRTIPPPP